MDYSSTRHFRAWKMRRFIRNSTILMALATWLAIFRIIFRTLTKGKASIFAALLPALATVYA